MGSIESMRAVARNRALARVQLAMVTSVLADVGFLTAVVVWAYQASGAAAVGAFTAATFAVSAVVAPLFAAAADRRARRTVLLGVDGMRLALVVAATGCLALESPVPTLVLAGAVGVLSAPARSAHRAWLPSLATSPEELTAANASASTLESAAALSGPALAAALLASGGVSVTFLVLVLGFASSLVLVVGLRSDRASRRTTAAPSSLLRELGAGFALVLGQPGLRAVTVQVCAQTFIGGANRILLVVLAVEAFGTANGLGVLMAVMGGCAIVGGVVAMARVPVGRVARDLGAGVALWGVALLPVALLPSPALAVLAVVLIGLANPLVDVNLDTALQRLAPEHVLARVFGAIDALYVAAAALGAATAPLLLEHLGLRATLVVVGLPALASAALCWRRMRDLDARLAEPAATALLRGIPWFARLAPATLEGLARSMREEVVPAGAVLVSQGEPGTDFYVIAAGRVQVSQGGRRLRDQGAGDYFGEIALLHDVPRTATVVALEPTVVHRLEQSAFLQALGDTGREEARQVTATLM